MPYSVYPHTTSHQAIALTDSAAPQDIPCCFQYSTKKPSKFFRIIFISLKYYWRKQGGRTQTLLKSLW